MLDLETMGMAPDGAIASIGAIRFDPFGDEIADPFYTTVKLKGQEDVGRVFNGDTIAWWLQQSEAARQELTRAGSPGLETALQAFRRYVMECAAGAPCWAYPSTFDHVILRRAYDAVGANHPFTWRDEYCMAAFARLTPNVDRAALTVGTAHNALDDATHQARWLQAILRHRNWTR
jgi:hypothetical protein